LAGSVTKNVAKLSFASERMQAAERAHNFIVDFCLQRRTCSHHCRDIRWSWQLWSRSRFQPSSRCCDAMSITIL